jgi:large conductance mechanosensitive channel
MAKTSAAETKNQTTTNTLTRKEKRQREVKEVTTKLKNLNPLAKVEAEVVTGAIEKTARKQMNGFMDFLREQSVVGLAVGLVLGTQIKQVVDSIVANFINPFLGLILPGKGTLAEKVFTLHIMGKTGRFGWGAVANTFISFTAVAALVYFTYKSLKLDRLAKKKDEDKKEEKPKKKPKSTTKK